MDFFLLLLETVKRFDGPSDEGGNERWTFREGMPRYIVIVVGCFFAMETKIEIDRWTKAEKKCEREGEREREISKEDAAMHLHPGWYRFFSGNWTRYSRR